MKSIFNTLFLIIAPWIFLQASLFSKNSVTAQKSIAVSTLPQITLNYPNGGNIWQAGDLVTVEWSSQEISDVKIEWSPDNGTTWTTVATVSGGVKNHTFTAPNSSTSTAKVRVSGAGTSDVSDSAFTILPNENKTFKIVVLGSSTAAGVGPSNPENAWVWRYRKYLEQIDSRYDVVNLAVGGYTTYHILPTGTVNTKVSYQPDPAKNITKALSYSPQAIIINLPSNDAASGYPVADQLENYSKVLAVATAAKVSVWISTPQPRNFGSNTNSLNIQLEMLKATNANFGEKAIDFWSGFGVPDGNGILPQFNTDGIHMNDAAHLILFERVVAINIHGYAKNAVLATTDALVAVPNKLLVYPNPASDVFYAQYSALNHSQFSMKIYNAEGKMVRKIPVIKAVKGKVSVQRGALPPGLYVVDMSDGLTHENTKIVLK